MFNFILFLPHRLKKWINLSHNGTPVTVEELDDESWPNFIAGREAVVVITRADCQNCAPFVESLSSHDIPVGVVTLDKRGSGGFKSSFPRLSVEASVLPFSILFSRGEWLDSVMGARVGAVLEWFE